MNNTTLQFEHDCSDDIASMTQKADKVRCNFIRVNQWAHAEQKLRLQGQQRGFTLEYTPESGEVIPLPIDLYTISVKAKTSLLSSWTDELECFKDVRPQPRKFTGETYPLVRATNIANLGTVITYLTPKHSGRMRITPALLTGTWRMQTMRACDSTGLKHLYSITDIGTSFELSSGRLSTQVFLYNAFLIAGIKYQFVFTNATGATDSLSIDLTIEPDG